MLLTMLNASIYEMTHTHVYINTAFLFFIFDLRKEICDKQM